MTSAVEHILCPVCGGRVLVEHSDKVNRCEYCASPVLGPSQSRDCVNHESMLAKASCRVCGDLICEDCMQVRIGDYGGKLFTVVHCEKPECKLESEWAKPLNREFQKLTNFDWSDRTDNVILRVTGLGAILMMLFELFFIIAMIWIQYFTPWGIADPSPIGFIFLRGDLTVILSILGNVMSAIILQTALQVYVHERQLASGAFLLVFLIIEVVFLLARGLFFNLLSFPQAWLVPFLLVSFGAATLMIFTGSLAALGVGWKKRGQVEDAKIRLGLE
ncbi:MAG: B-box zinc finger protein [Candidatus Thorarchaeota archaeon]|nr:MAG: B-box zinc finger protein [Candidatus Thorarchaeota archaeon]